MATAAPKTKAKAKKAPVRKTAAKKTTAKKAAPKKVTKLNFAEQAQENARNVFLAGLGAYGKAFEEAQSQIKDAQAQMKENRNKAEDLFSELVKRGEKVETKAKKKLKEIELPELKMPELKLADREELREELRNRLDMARDSFQSLRNAVSSKAA
jgi:hypothetical protein